MGFSSVRGKPYQHWCGTIYAVARARTQLTFAGFSSSSSSSESSSSLLSSSTAAAAAAFAFGAYKGARSQLGHSAARMIA